MNKNYDITKYSLDVQHSPFKMHATCANCIKF